ncbi:hypothetical protein Sgleb_33130 [Streptomyces glebosus]|uniref:Uncharacterized protein n=1 Tax=Streptomyces glebosus TaxID=249580 RepID=A0A640SYY0_9ACTN|nr:hypothetical protein [Streptomyces glebosus]GFE15266.1 hypothetical protein Sgleb_33130 [Streptomyces glebosus]GHG73416.1 hypothetical protein GCM10010513_46790 [Streptomyces glebosus]
MAWKDRGTKPVMVGVFNAEGKRVGSQPPADPPACPWHRRCGDAINQTSRAMAAPHNLRRMPLPQARVASAISRQLGRG